MDARVPVLSEPFAAWFASRGWAPRAHQLELVRRAQDGLSTLLIAPTGAGKTLAGFLPSLIELAPLAEQGGLRRPHKLHTLYISPLKALTTDVARNLETPVREMKLSVRIETRTGDTPPHKRQRQRAHPPDILLTTPEQLCLLIASEHARVFFEDLQTIVIDEAHALAPTKRGDLLALAMARLQRWAPAHRRVGLSATVADEEGLVRWLLGSREQTSPLAGEMAAKRPEGGRSAAQAPDRLHAPRPPTPSPQGGGGIAGVIVRAPPGAQPVVDVLDSDARIPWAGHTARHAMPEIYEAIKRTKLALVFVNTRAQAEMTFQELWRINDDALPIALHHGSLDVGQRRKVEAAMAAGQLRAVVCTSTLDLGIDWGDVDLVIQIGAPKGCSRLVQRIGRANHRYNEPSRALLAPSNRFEVLECRCAQDAVMDGELDGEQRRIGGLDCLAQHIMGCACGEPFDADELYEEVVSTAPYADLPRAQFDRTIDLVATGGYALRAYDRYRRIVQDPHTHRWRARNASVAQQHRMNVGAIVESEMLDVRMAHSVGARPRPGTPKSEGPRPLVAGRRLGQIEEYFIEGLTPGDTFIFAGQVLRFIGQRETDALVVPAVGAENPSIPSYAGGKFPLSTFLADRVRQMLHEPKKQKNLPPQVREWIKLQKRRSIVPAPDEMLVETFPRANKHYLVAYPFDGRLAQQTLGVLITRRLERAGKHPLGFLASEYAMAVWGLEPMGDLDLDALFDEDMLGDDLESWLAESTLMKSTFSKCAVIAGMIERKMPGAAKKTGRQVTFSSDLIYDVLKQYEPDHILMQAAFADAGEGYLDLRRVGALLRRVKGRIIHRDLPHVSPFAAPVMLEMGRVGVQGEAEEAILADAAALIEEAMS
ncbi:MAG TPA: ligase-associated DNA damage response DEXH box helicase [Vitreimonas sp.]|uniref:ligase-associated DNA damage response DEXH box helicase n=1 Tax=Vitreimonas sp. TaxID=3069702 RepID=UPI002D3A39CA|nr:ligase-associated DNA damage response DEXH box helicase [Vitreimonas sp.]HYD86642.1 ligase-associated DNA damage response DEXH box helicase [Vitreimonas sp.]